TSPDKLRDALPVMMRELKRTLDPGYFTATKLEEVKAHRATDSAFGRERTVGFSHALGFWWSVAGLEYYLNYLDEMARQKPSDLVDYARKYIIDKPHVTGALLSGGLRQRLGLSATELARLGGWK